MTNEEFTAELRRLETQWPNSYGPARRAVIFRAFEKVDVTLFRDAVNECLAAERSAPLVPELEREITSARQRGREISGAFSSPAALLRAAAEHTPNHEFTSACMKVLSDKNTGKLTGEQFQQACNMLDETAERLTSSCNLCNDTGYTTQGAENYLWRCPCSIGRARPELMYGPQRSDGTRESYYIAIWRRPIHQPTGDIHD